MENKNGKAYSDFNIIRWRPDFRYVDDKFESVETKLFKSTEPSVTDKEAYRLTLASLRGEMSAQGNGKIDVGQYSIKAGEEYDPKKDFSFLNRKDLTIVELDNYIKVMTRKLEESDSELSRSIEDQIAKAEKIKQTLETSDINKNEDVNK